MNIGGAATSSSAAYGTYYDAFYPNGSHATWTAYGAPPPPPTSSSSGPCGLLSAGHKGLSSAHFTPVHSRRKRRVLFTQAQVSQCLTCHEKDDLDDDDLEIIMMRMMLLKMMTVKDEE